MRNKVKKILFLHIKNVVSTLVNVVKLDVENDNIVSALPNVVHMNVEIDKVDSNLLNVKFVKFKVDGLMYAMLSQC